MPDGYEVPFYNEVGGAKRVIGDGGELEVQEGGVIDLRNSSEFQRQGVDKLALLDESLAFFAATDISGAEAEELVGAGLTALHTHAMIEHVGVKAVNTLRLASDVVDGQAITIGGDVYEVDIINTDSGDNTAGGSFNNVTDPLTVDMTAYVGIDAVLVAGDLIRIETEYLRVTLVAGHDYTFERGACGTTPAAHGDAVDIFISDAPGMANIPLGFDATLTPAVASLVIPATINEMGVEPISAKRISNNEVLLYADAVGVLATGTTETLAGANNAFDQATMVRGEAAGYKAMARITRVPTAQEVTLGNLHIALDFTPTWVQVDVRVTATKEAKAWTGTWAIASDVLTLTNAGGTAFAETDTIYVLAIE